MTESRGYCVTHSIILASYSLTETALVTKNEEAVIFYHMTA